MSAFSNRREVLKDVLPSARRLPARPRRTVPSALGVAALLACLFVATPDGTSVPVSKPANDPPPAPYATYDGLTRDTLAELDAPPEPAPLAAASAASVQEMDDQARANAAARRRRRARRHRHAVQSPPPMVVVKAPQRRNPVVSFVYWWNGWVIKTFHTKVGTVMLGTVGAKT